MAKRILAVQESDLRMDGDLAMNIQRVLPVTQADINTAAQNGEHWLVERVIEVTAPIDNSHGETLRVIKQNQILPGQNVLRVLIQSAPQTVQTTVGPAVSPLALNNALDSSLTELTAFGGAYQGLPDGYTVLDYVENTTNTDVDLGIALEYNDKFEIFVRTMAVAGNFPLIQSVDSNNVWRGIGGSSTGSILARAGNMTDSNTVSGMTRTAGDVYQITFMAANGDQTLKVYDEVSATSDVRTSQYTVGYNIPNTLHLFKRDNVYMPAGCRIYALKITEYGTVIGNFIPCKNANGAGLFDTVSKRFIQTISGSLNAGNPTTWTPTQNNSIPITCNNGDLKVNTLDGTFYCDGPNEEIEIGPSHVYGATCENLLKLSAGTKVWQDKHEIIAGDITRMVGVKALDGSETWIYDPTYNRFYTDFADCIQGTVARVYPALCTHFRNLHNQESMSSITQGDFYIGNAGRIYFHADTNDVVAWQNWLNNRYNNNDPVIIMFPLENITQEQVPPQTMRTQSGNNTAEITQASVPNLELLATYTEVL